MLEVVRSVLARAPDGIFSQAGEEALASLTPKILCDAANSLVASGSIDLAEELCRPLSQDPAFGAWPHVVLARIATTRGDSTNALARWKACLCQFPARVEPYWFVEIVKAERKQGNSAAADNYLKQGFQQFPNSFQLSIARAETLLADGIFEESVTAYRDALSRFPDKVLPHWYTGLVSALRGAGRSEEESEVTVALARHFPADPQALAFCAQQAMKKENWRGARALWGDCIANSGERARPEWLCGHAKVLFRLGRPAEALSIWSEVRRRHPDFVPGLTDAARANQELGRWAEADRLWEILISRHADRMDKSWHISRAICRSHLPHEFPVQDVVAELDSRCPDFPNACHLAIRDTARTRAGGEDVEMLVASALARFPSDRQILANKVDLLLASGDLKQAEHIVEVLETGAADSLAVSSRWSVELDRSGAGAIRESVERTASIRDWPLMAGLALCRYILGLRNKWACSAALVLSRNIAERFPSDVTALAARAEVLIEAGLNDEASATIDAIPAEYETELVLQLRGWRAAQRGQLGEARKLSEKWLTNTYHSQLNGPMPELELLSAQRADDQKGGVTAFVPVRDELTNLPAFLQHHRRIGVRQFVIVDNMSSDGTVDYLLSQPDVILYRTTDSFRTSGSGMRWINLLIESHGKGGWCLYADADEEFVYPGWETVSLDELVHFLDREGAEAMAGFMLDLYPAFLIDSAGQPAGRNDCRYYDRDYSWQGQAVCPYRRPVGGVRERIFGAVEWLHKTPLIKSGRGVYLTAHDTTPLALSGISGALLHYKCTDLLSKGGGSLDIGSRTVEDRMPGCLRRYERYSASLRSLAGVDLREPGVTQVLTDSISLVDQGLMAAPADYREWLNELACQSIQVSPWQGRVAASTGRRPAVRGSKRDAAGQLSANDDAKWHPRAIQTKA